MMRKNRDTKILRLCILSIVYDTLSRIPIFSTKRRRKLKTSASRRRERIEKIILGGLSSSAATKALTARSGECVLRSREQTIQLPNGDLVALQTDIDARRAVHRILVVCPIPPTINHAGGLRQIDMLHRIKKENARTYIELFTRTNVGFCGPLSTVSQIVDKLVIAPYDDMSLAEYIRLSPTCTYFDVIDFQFPAPPEVIDAYHKIGRKLIFTPMESHIRNAAIARGLSQIPREEISEPEAMTELRICELVDETVCVSEMDREAISAVTEAKVVAIETGISDIEFSGNIVPVDPYERAVSYVAYFGSPTNREALKWYLDLVHPLVLAAVGDYQFRIIGRGEVSDIIGDR